MGDKFYITLTSKDEKTTGDIIHNSTIDYWRGYVDDKNSTPVYYTPAKSSVKNSWHRSNENGFKLHENIDEKNPNLPYYDYLIPNYVSP